MRVGKTFATSAALAWLFVSVAPLGAADISERALNGDSYQCPQVAPEEPDALAEYQIHACADYNMETGAIGDVPVDDADQLPEASSAIGVTPPDGGGVTPPVDDGGGVTPPDNCLPNSVEVECLPEGEGPKGNNGVGNGLDPQPPGNPPINDGPGTAPGTPGNQGGAPSTTP